MRAPSRAALLLALLSSAAPSHAQEESAREAPASEGALNNDVFVPQAEAALALLASGDAALLQARAAAAAGTVAEAERQLFVACDHWRNALVVGGPGASTWSGTPENGEQRLSEGVHAGVVRRLLALAADERARWQARHGPEAELALSQVHDGHSPALRATRLVEVARLYPLTSAGARAALELGDLALEAGLLARARGWYARARLEAERAGARALLPALEARRTRLGARSPDVVEPWQHASACDFADSFSWSDPGRRARRAAGAEHWLRPGGAFLGSEHFALQTADELVLLSLAPNGELELVERQRTSDLLGGYAPGEFEAPREPPGWPLLPFADELGLVLVAGRTNAEEPNVLLALTLDLPAAAHLSIGLQLGTTTPAARLAWAIVGSERIDAAGATPVPELEELGPFEFQPGPVASGDLVVAQVRQFDGQVRSHLLAFDRRDGTLSWQRQLAAGADRVVTPRFAQSSKRVAGQPLLALDVGEDPCVFAGTHLGLGVLFSSLLGEPLWSLKNRRRDEREPGWSGDRPLLGRNPDGTPVVLWAPMDSDRLYCLVPRALAETSGASLGVLACPPEPLGEAQSLLGGDAREQLVLGRIGREHTVTARRVGRDRIDSLELGPDERFAGTGSASLERAWVSTNRGLYLLDRTRELFLLDHDELPPAGGEPRGGDVYTRGAFVLVLGSGTLWSFRVR